MTNVARLMELADAKAAGKKAKSKKAAAKKTAKKASLEVAKAEVQKLEADGPLVRLIFPCTKDLAERIKVYWHAKGLGSKSEAIRVLLERGLGK